MGLLSPARAPQFMGDAVSTDSETERKLYAQIAGWIENKKILTDMTFVVCYGRAFYDLAMEFAYERDAEYGRPPSSRDSSICCSCHRFFLDGAEAPSAGRRRQVSVDTALGGLLLV